METRRLTIPPKETLQQPGARLTIEVVSRRCLTRCHLIGVTGSLGSPATDQNFDKKINKVRLEGAQIQRGHVSLNDRGGLWTVLRDSQINLNEQSLPRKAHRVWVDCLQQFQRCVVGCLLLRRLRLRWLGRGWCCRNRDQHTSSICTRDRAAEP